jgi:hypothetical protein
VYERRNAAPVRRIKKKTPTGVSISRGALNHYVARAPPPVISGGLRLPDGIDHHGQRGPPPHRALTNFACEKMPP